MSASSWRALHLNKIFSCKSGDVLGYKKTPIAPNDTMSFEPIAKDDGHQVACVGEKSPVPMGGRLATQGCVHSFTLYIHV